MTTVPNAAALRGKIVVVKYGGQKAGLVVDTLLGEFQTVIKPLSRMFRSLRGISGSSILGNGEVALIFDIAERFGCVSMTLEMPFKDNAQLPNAETGWNGERYGAFHSWASWRGYLMAAGFTELSHYYRPAGLPLAQQPWLASVWRKPVD